MANCKEFSKEEKKDIVRQFESGVDQKSISEHFGCSITRIRTVLHHAGRLKKRKRPDAEAVKKSDYVKTPCKCPRCEKDHVMVLFWVGLLPARKMCKKCNDLF